MKITSRIRARRDESRARHDFERAVDGAATPAHRQELLALARHAVRYNVR